LHGSILRRTKERADADDHAGCHRAPQGVGSSDCPAGPNAADGLVFDPLPVLERWRETGAAPSDITIRRRTAGADAGVLTVRPYMP
jgi:hypothetical protein